MSVIDLLENFTVGDLLTVKILNCHSFFFQPDYEPLTQATALLSSSGITCK